MHLSPARKAAAYTTTQHWPAFVNIITLPLVVTGYSEGSIAIALTLAMNIMSTFQWAINTSIEVEGMVSAGHSAARPALIEYLVLCVNVIIRETKMLATRLLVSPCQVS